MAHCTSPIALAVALAVALAFPWWPAAAQDQGTPARATGTGPMLEPGAPPTAQLWQAGDAGERLHLRGRVVDGSGRPLAGAVLQVWQADGDGAYRDDRYRAQLETAVDGTFQIATVLPGQYWGAKHIHVIVRHPTHAPLSTRIMFKGDPNIDEAVDGDLAILLEEVRRGDEVVLVGGVEFVLQPGG